MRKKTARTPRTQGPRHLVRRGLIAKADIPRERSAVAECALDNHSHRTSLGFCCGHHLSSSNVCQRRYPGTCYARERNARRAARRQQARL